MHLLHNDYFSFFIPARTLSSKRFLRFACNWQNTSNGAETVLLRAMLCLNHRQVYIHMLIEPQNSCWPERASGDCLVQSSLLRAETAWAGCSELGPVGFWISSRMGSPQTLWATRSRVWPPPQQKKNSYVYLECPYFNLCPLLLTSISTERIRVLLCFLRSLPHKTSHTMTKRTPTWALSCQA